MIIVQNINVEAGNYIISKRKKGKATAFLGTCVGLTLRDLEAGISGLIHILLPEPTGIKAEWDKFAYASTGVPSFINEICKKGAKRDRLEACVGGGGLIGPVTELDLDLNIGGRSTDIVFELLKKERIPVINAETGGYFSTKMELDLENMNTTITPFDDPVMPKKIKRTIITSDKIPQKIHDIYPVPQVALKISRMLSSEDYNFKEIAYEIRHDQVLSANILKICNSSFMGLKKRVESIDRALVIIGEKALLKIILSASLKPYFDSISGYSLCKGGLFYHAIKTAMLSEEIARNTKVISPDVAYTSGLIHDIGKAVLDQYILSSYPLFYRETQFNMKDLCEVEKNLTGISHPEAGGILAREWLLSDVLREAIMFHHDPEESHVSPEVTHIVHLADLIVSRFHAGYDINCSGIGNIPNSMKIIGLKKDQFASLIELLPKKVTAIPE